MAIPILSLIVLIPILFAVLTLFTKTKEQARAIALFASVLVLALSMFMYFNFDSTTPQMQFQEFAQWVPSLGINYQLGIDGISMPLVLLNAIVIPFLILFSWNDDKKQPNRFYAPILATQGAVIGVFVALDFFLFYVLGTYLGTTVLHGKHLGGPGKHKASIKFFIYTCRFTCDVAGYICLYSLPGNRRHSKYGYGAPATVPVHSQWSIL